VGARLVHAIAYIVGVVASVVILQQILAK